MCVSTLKIIFLKRNDCVYLRYRIHFVLKNEIQLSAKKDKPKDSHSDYSVRQNSKMRSRYKGLFQEEKRVLYSLSLVEKRAWIGIFHNWTEEVRN